MNVGIVYDPVYLRHDTGEHVENRRRLEAIVSHLEQSGTIQALTPIKPRAATVEELALAHDRQHISHVFDVGQRGGGWLDADTVMSSESYMVATYAAGGAIAATDAVVGGQVASVFALLRPPGHHATRRQAMGFCLFNNVAIATRYALTSLGVKRVAIIDFDVHHGNGTQDIFNESPEVLYVSTHEYPFYPGTGRVEDTGRDGARGTKVNIPLPAGCGDDEYLSVFEQIVRPAVRRFQPELMMVSAGYDLHWADPLAQMELTTIGFARIVSVIKELAAELCQGRIVICLEGGYHPQALAHSVKATFDVLLGRGTIDDPLGPPPRRSQVSGLDALISRIRGIHGLT